jgi:hypothetical protein
MKIMVRSIYKELWAVESELQCFCIFTSSSILKTRKHNVSETGSVSVLRKGGGGDTYSVGSHRKC